MLCWLIKVSVRNFMAKLNNIQLMTLSTFSRKVKEIIHKKEITVAPSVVLFSLLT